MRKKSRLLLILSILIFAISSCEKKEVFNHPILSQNDKNLAILFSDENSINEEGNYYDALLEMKKQHPETFNYLSIIHSSERELIRHYDIENFPTLLILHNQDVIVRIDGLLEKNEICTRLEKAIFN